MVTGIALIGLGGIGRGNWREDRKEKRGIKSSLGSNIQTRQGKKKRHPKGSI